MKKLLLLSHWLGLLWVFQLGWLATPAAGAAVANVQPAPPSSTPKPTASSLRAQKAAEVAESQSQVASGNDTTTTRLKALQAAIEIALTDLQQSTSNPSGPVLADLHLAQAEVTQGLDYVTAHPDIDPLPKHPPSGNDWNPRLGTLTPRSDKNFTGLVTALERFIGGLNYGQPNIGEIGGHRDAIMRDVAMAIFALAAAAQEPRPSVAKPETSPPVPAGSSVQPGSISGTVAEGASSASAPRVLITYIAVHSPTFKVAPRGAGGNQQLLDLGGLIPATFSDDKGGFFIGNLPPGFYALGIAGNTGVVIVEVKAGAETKLSSSLKRLPPFAGAG